MIDWQAAMAEAERASGLSDFGGDDFEDGLRAFAGAVNRADDLPDAARAGAAGLVQGLLTRRLELYRDRALYPEIAAQRIERPLIVVGLPRAGTTFLHALLAQDPAARSALAWQVSQPSPPPRRETAPGDPRVAACEARLAAVPIEFKRMHMIGATLPEECNSFTTLAFQSPNLGAMYRLPSYSQWFLDAAGGPAYRLHHDMLQHLQAFVPAGWWVLKSPPHTFHLDRLVATYPDARIVFPHRDPAATLPSLASLIAFLRQGVYGAIDETRVGPEMLAFWKVAIDRAMAFRADPAQAERFVDVPYDALVRDPMATVRRVYGHFGMTLSPDAEAAMARFLHERPKDSHGAHRYTAERFGLRAGQIRDAFGDYIRRHLDDRIAA